MFSRRENIERAQKLEARVRELRAVPYPTEAQMQELEDARVAAAGVRKTPVLLRRGPLSGSIQALTSYRRTSYSGADGRKEILRAANDGKHDVTADFDALVLEGLLDGGCGWPPSPDIAAILDGVADGDSITPEQREQVRGFRERLRAQIERHNTTGHGSPEAAA